MSGIQVTITTDTASPYFRRLSAETRGKLQDVVDLWAQRTRNVSIRGILKGPKTGRTYLRGKNRNIAHRASAPGEYPATDTGYLASHIFAQSGSGFSEVGTTARYGPWLEFGTARMAARPWLGRALEETREEVRKAMEKVLA